ncbi:Polysaccharide pyruvyl transferase [Noviherbaspirillum humi]|uniref:Polysaccharide pyruvyl transferase n=1 Tax=Noviherbaspirillum humi TaxID=1688639 RepID=A0A239LJW4_9BURK|nr:polysaccharide pyruvyl transferase family protein [Noviherbaspirillum humi]SNT30182.1 Polysaccharide pyruvyl transferase [Noviherbaspirillum humi]
MDRSRILFGAFDRHNFGDLLFPHILAAMLHGRTMRHAGLAQRDLRHVGGHAVESLAHLGASLRQPADLIHAGGELLTCGAWEAAVMLQNPRDAEDLVTRFDAHSKPARYWAAQAIGRSDRVPYLADASMLSGGGRCFHHALGGVQLDAMPGEMRDEVLAKLGRSARLSVRDRVTREALRSAGIQAALTPDPAVMVRSLFDHLIQTHAQRGEAAGLIGAFPAGYLALQFSADFGDDATLDAIAAQCEVLRRATGLVPVLFRAGAAPWHDDLDVYQRLAQRLKAARVFQSLHLWDICALIARSRAYAGSSLHGRIVATAYGLPRVNMLPPWQGSAPSKQHAYAATWEMDGVPLVSAVDEFAAALEAALAIEGKRYRHWAERLASEYRTEFASFAAALGT